MIKEVTEYIGNNTSFVRDTDLFAGHRPKSAPDRCQCILEAGGGATFYDISDRIDKMIQVLSRSTTFFTARSDAYIIYNWLVPKPYSRCGFDLPVVTVGEAYYCMIVEAIQPPAPIGQDENGRWEFSTNYIFRIRDK